MTFSFSLLLLSDFLGLSIKVGHQSDLHATTTLSRQLNSVKVSQRRMNARRKKRKLLSDSPSSRLRLTCNWPITCNGTANQSQMWRHANKKEKEKKAVVLQSIEHNWGKDHKANKNREEELWQRQLTHSRRHWQMRTARLGANIAQVVGGWGRKSIARVTVQWD